MTSAPTAVRPTGRLSWLLLATVLALLPALGVRVGALWPHLADRFRATAAVVTATGDWRVAALIEPGAGPDPAAAVPTRPVRSAAASVAAGDPATLAAVEELAAELKRQQATLAQREQSITVREAVVTAVEARVATQVGRLEALNAELERLLGQVDADERARTAQLVKVYEAMKAKNAAMIFDPMGLDLLLPIVRGMRETKVAAIVAEMDPANARALTAELARSHDLPPPL